MMKFIGFEREEEAEAWARERLNAACEPELYRAMAAVDERGEFACAIVFSNFTSRNIDLNFAARDGRWITPDGAVEMFNGIFDYAFNTLRAARCTSLIKGQNIKSRKFVEQLGFKLEGIMRSAFDDDDLYIYGFLASEYYTHDWYRGKR